MAFKVINGKLVRIRNNRTLYPQPAPVPKVPEAPSLKGKYQGLCNRSACLEPGATWWNTGSWAYYCGPCARLINEDGCQRYGQPDICHKVHQLNPDGSPQFNPTLNKTPRDYLDIRNEDKENHVAY